MNKDLQFLPGSEVRVGDNGNGRPDIRRQLDEEFPLGDGVAETEASIVCPYCGESVEVAVDPGSGTEQEYVEDCPVCCRPWQVLVQYAPDGNVDVRVEPLDET